MSQKKAKEERQEETKEPDILDSKAFITMQGDLLGAANLILGMQFFPKAFIAVLDQLIDHAENNPSGASSERLHAIKRVSLAFYDCREVLKKEISSIIKTLPPKPKKKPVIYLNESDAEKRKLQKRPTPKLVFPESVGKIQQVEEEDIP